MPVQKAKTEGITREELARRLLEIGRMTLDIEGIEAEMQAEIDAVKARYSTRLERKKQTLENREKALRLLCEDGRETLLGGVFKSVQTLFGTAGWRTQPHRVVFARGISTATAVARLEGARHPELVRVKKEVDKDAVRIARGTGNLDEQEMKSLGLVLKPGGEDWFYKLDRARISEEVDKG